jgi:hypothetical protein
MPNIPLIEIPDAVIGMLRVADAEADIFPLTILWLNHVRV